MKYCMNVTSATKSPMLRECSCCGISIVVGSPFCGISVVVESLLLWDLSCCGTSVVVGPPLLWALHCVVISVVVG